MSAAKGIYVPSERYIRFAPKVYTYSGKGIYLSRRAWEATARPIRSASARYQAKGRISRLALSTLTKTLTIEKSLFSNAKVEIYSQCNNFVTPIWASFYNTLTIL